MDEFPDDRSELSGTLMSLEFGPDGRITHIWAADPALPEAGEEFQFVLGPVSFGEEFSEDYFPGTILLGARTTPDEPWIVSRNSGAALSEDFDEPGVVQFEYEFPLLPEVKAIGRYYERGGTVPQVCWDVRIVNQGRVSIEIGELAFPFAFYNFMQGASRDERTGRNPYEDRVYIHKFIGGTASYLHAQRMSNEPPGLLVFPGDGTSWEMYAHVPRTLSSPYHWEGIPVVYVFSRASVDRESWASSYLDHSSLILEPGDSKTVQTRFVPTSPSISDPVFQTLAACGKPVMRLLPAAVSPCDVGIGIEVSGVSPQRVTTSREASLEVDADEAGAFVLVRPQESGNLRMVVEDSSGGLSSANLLFIEPIADLIRRRARWIFENQFHTDPQSSLHNGVLLTNVRTQQRLVSPDEYSSPFALESGLWDALFLAEKNSIYPNAAEVARLERYLDEFLRDDIHNPGDGLVGSVFVDMRSVALDYGRPRVYAPVALIYQAMYRIGSRFGLTMRDPIEYLQDASNTAELMLGIATRHTAGGLPGFSRVIDLIEDLVREGMDSEASDLHAALIAKARDVARMPIVDNSDLTGDAGRFEELFWAGRYLGDYALQDIAIRHAFALRDLGPNWWSYGSDYHIFHESDGVPRFAVADKGQLMLGHSSVANSLMLFESLDVDHGRADETFVRMAYGGMLGVWALVRADGAASMGFCPDAASEQYGFNPLTGDIGMPLFHYLRKVKAVVLPSAQQGVSTFGCHFEAEADHYVVQPWDGVGQRIAIRHIGLDVQIDVGNIGVLRIDIRKRWAELEIANPTDMAVGGSVLVRGLWGRAFTCHGEVYEVINRVLRVPFELKPDTVTQLRIEMVK